MKFSFVVFVLFSLENATGWEFRFPKLQNLNPYCALKECCNEGWIKFDRGRLISDLRSHVYGQPLVHNVVDALTSHLSPNYSPSKPLTLSFHGWTGSGKNYVSSFIVDSIYRMGIRSGYVHHFIGRLHFSEVSKTKEYQTQLTEWLRTNVSSCPQQLFIFDEVDKMIPEVLDAIKPMIDHRGDVEKVDYRRSIFIFLSNTGSEIINEHYYDLYKAGHKREDLRLSDFDYLIKKGAFNEKGGFFKGDLVKTDLIDHYIPFLPMEEKHVKLCIEHEFRLRNVENPQEIHKNEVLQIVQWGPDESKLFSKTGCKRIGSQVGLLVAKHYSHLLHQEEL